MSEAPVARIYRPAKTAMQSGRRKTGAWVLEFIPQERKVIEHIMGWTGSGDMLQQLKLAFPTKEEAVSYAEERGIRFVLGVPHDPALQVKAYADNFSFNRVRAYAGLTNTPAAATPRTPTPSSPARANAAPMRQQAAVAQEAGNKAIEPAAATTKKMVAEVARPITPVLKPAAKKKLIQVAPRPVAGQKPRKTAELAAPKVTKPIASGTAKPAKPIVALKKPLPKRPGKKK